MSIVKLLFSFQGRINRGQYWLGGLIIGAVGALAVIGAIGHVAGHGIDMSIVPLMFCLGVLYLVLVWVGTALNVKRLHDRGRTGYIAAFAFLPMALLLNMIFTSKSPADVVGASMMINLVATLINGYFLVDLGMMPSQPGPNRYDDTPGGNSPTSPFEDRSKSFVLNNAQSAMERAIGNQNSAPTTAKVQAAAPAPQATRPAALPAPRAPQTPSPAPGAPRAFGKRTSA